MGRWDGTPASPPYPGGRAGQWDHPRFSTSRPEPASQRRQGVLRSTRTRSTRYLRLQERKPASHRCATTRRQSHHSSWQNPRCVGQCERIHAVLGLLRERLHDCSHQGICRVSVTSCRNIPLLGKGGRPHHAGEFGQHLPIAMYMPNACIAGYFRDNEFTAWVENHVMLWRFEVKGPLNSELVALMGHRHHKVLISVPEKARSVSADRQSSAHKKGSTAMNVDDGSGGWGGAG